MKVKIDNVELLREKLHTGICFFTGAGFSSLPDKNGKKLPTAKILAQDIVDKFEIDNVFDDDLTYISEQCPPDELDKFLREKFTVTSYNPLYKVLNKVKIKTFVTTNIDCLHSLAGSKSVAELQGSFGINKCLSCGKHYDDVFIWNQGKAPKCKVCGGVIAPFPVYEHIGLADTEVGKARDWLSRAELVLIIGTNGPYGNVYFNYIWHSAKIVQINPKHTQFDKIVNLNIHSKSDDVLSLL